MVSGESPLKPDEDGGYFIDRDPAHFGIILSSMRAGKLVISSTFTDFPQLFTELEYYKLPFNLPVKTDPICAPDFTREQFLNSLADESSTFLSEILE